MGVILIDSLEHVFLIKISKSDSLFLNESFLLMLMHLGFF